MKLYQFAATPSCRKVRMFLEEKGIVVPTIDANDGMALADWYCELYPHRMTPMLELDDGTQLGESVAICRYFETLHPDPPLMGTDAKDRALVEMWERRAYLEGAAAIEEIFRNSHPICVGRGLQGTAERVDQIPVLVDRGRARLRRFYDKLERQLDGNRHVVGERFSIADITTLVSIDFGRWCQLDIPAACINVQRWYSDVAARPSAAA
ncbi:MAG: glutathione S-transferase N-terminal domain-containing protein [Burkholderiales bacterium]|nr:glutathione S-transferase N-terminal domain-containing protein [Burkholderiales bacterium]